MAKTVRMTTAQAIVKFLDNQYVSMDGVETKFVEGFFTIFGHGIAVGLGEALDTNPGQLKVLQGRNEQGMCHVATAFAAALPSVRTMHSSQYANTGIGSQDRRWS